MTKEGAFFKNFLKLGDHKFSNPGLIFYCFTKVITTKIFVKNKLLFITTILKLEYLMYIISFT